MAIWQTDPSQSTNTKIFLPPTLPRPFHPSGRVSVRLDVTDKETLEFNNYQNKSVHLVDNKEIHLFCNGPYILHMYVCYKGLEGPGRGRLELRRAGMQTLTNLTLAAGKEVTCRGLHATVDLRKKEWATLSFFSEGETLKVKNLTVGLRYLLGQCQY